MATDIPNLADLLDSAALADITSKLEGKRLAQVRAADYPTLADHLRSRSGAENTFILGETILLGQLHRGTITLQRKPDNHNKLREDVNEAAFRVVQGATGEGLKPIPPEERTDQEKDSEADGEATRAHGGRKVEDVKLDHYP